MLRWVRPVPSKSCVFNSSNQSTTKHTGFKGLARDTSALAAPTTLLTITLVSRGLSKGVHDAVKDETNSFEELCF